MLKEGESQLNRLAFLIADQMTKGVPESLYKLTNMAIRFNAYQIESLGNKEYQRVFKENAYQQQELLEEFKKTYKKYENQLVSLMNHWKGQEKPLHQE